MRMPLFGRKKAEFPIAQNMLESSEDGDMVECCMQAYGQLLDEDVARSSLPMPLRQVREASTFVTWVINGGNGFRQYLGEEGWDVERLAAALSGLDTLGLKEIADRLRPFVDQISAVAHDPSQRDGAIDTAWRAFDGEHLKSVNQAWIFHSNFVTKAKAHLLENMTFNVVSAGNFDAALSRYKAGL
ncbi:MAG: hypothetical protein ACRCS3_04535 [Paracoccaceae bacterium]